MSSALFGRGFVSLTSLHVCICIEICIEANLLHSKSSADALDVIVPKTPHYRQLSQKISIFIHFTSLIIETGIVTHMYVLAKSRHAPATDLYQHNRRDKFYINVLVDAC